MVTRSEPIPVHLIRRGPLARHTGGPIRVITDLLDTYEASGRYGSYGYVSVNDARMFHGGEAAAASGRKDSPAKHAAAKKLNASNLGLYLQLRRDAWRLRNRLLRIAAPGQVIHSHDQIASGLAFSRPDPSHILTIHSKGSILNDVKLKAHPQIAGTWMQREFVKLERAGIDAAGIVTFPSEGARALFERDVPHALDGKDVRIVHNGVVMGDFAAEVPKRGEQDVFTIVNVSALVEEKRFDRTLEIAALLHARGREFRLLHFGSGHLASQMQQEVMKRNLQDVVVFIGRTKHESIVSEMSNAHAFLLPAERTVFDIASLEAMAAGLPVVLSDEGGNREMVAHGSDGFLCAPDDAKAFADTLEALMDSESLRFAAGKAARETVQARFTMERVIEQFAVLYEEVTDHRL